MRKVWTSFKSLASLGLATSLGLFSLGLGSCGGSSPPPEEMMMPMPQTPEVIPMNPEFAFDHNGSLVPVGDLFEDGQQLPVERSQRMHACGKISYPTLGRILSRRGVSITSGAQCTDSGGSFDCTSGSLYANGSLVLGIANYGARVSESDRNSTGGIVRLQDILIAAAEQILNASPDGVFGPATDCAGSQLFNPGTPATCNADGFACFVGVPLTAGQMTLCNQMLADPANTDPTGIVPKKLTLAALASTIYLCD